MVNVYCDQKDHHPEWRSDDGGRLVHVKLTSHFAGNTVSLLDYELAEHMNKAFVESQSALQKNKDLIIKTIIGVTGLYIFAYQIKNRKREGIKWI